MRSSSDGSSPPSAPADDGVTDRTDVLVGAVGVVVVGGVALVAWRRSRGLRS